MHETLADPTNLKPNKKMPNYPATYPVWHFGAAVTGGRIHTGSLLVDIQNSIMVEEGNDTHAFLMAPLYTYIYILSIYVFHNGKLPPQY